MGWAICWLRDFHQHPLLDGVCLNFFLASGRIYPLLMALSEVLHCMIPIARGLCSYLLATYLCSFRKSKIRKHTMVKIV